MADPKQEESFKVIDRRLFNEEGALRKDVVEEEARREEEAAARAASRANAQASAKKPDGHQASGANAAAKQTAGREEQDLETEAPQGSRSFQMLIDFLARNGAAMLGGMADPRTGQAFLDLEGARDVIDMLDALREKTRGNLSKNDDELLVEVIGQLKLTYMEMSKVAAEAAMAKKPAQKK